MSQFKNEWSQGDWNFSRIGNSKFYEVTCNAVPAVGYEKSIVTDGTNESRSEIVIPFPHRLISLFTYHTTTLFLYTGGFLNVALAKRLTTIPNLPNVQQLISQQSGLGGGENKVVFEMEETVSKPAAYALYLMAAANHVIFPILIVERLEEETDFA